MRELKFFLLSSVIVAIIWLMLSQISILSGTYFLSIIGYELGILISITIGVIFSSYISLWKIGKLTVLKMNHAIIVGILSFIFILVFDIISGYIYYRRYAFLLTPSEIWSFIQSDTFDHSLFMLLGSLIGGFLGVRIIQRGSPMFSPNVPQTPQPRSSKNWIKIITTFAVGLLCFYFAEGFFYALGHPISDGGRGTATFGGPFLLICGLFIIGIGLYDLLKKNSD